MTNFDLKNLSPFGQHAMQLDSDLREFEQLQGQIERLEIDSDFGLERAKELLTKFSECGLLIGQGVQGFAKVLEEARIRAEAAASSVSQRAELVQQRQQKCLGLTERFESLAEMVRKITQAVGQLGKKSGGEFSEEEKAMLTEKLPELESQFGMLANNALQLRNDARDANMKSLERNVEGLVQNLQTARRKIGSLVPRSLMV